MPQLQDQPQQFDLVILGGGSGGYACALRARQHGLSVALVEKSKVGGTCLHQGCIPTKALLHAAEVADAARTAPRFGVLASLDGIDMPAVLDYKDKVVTRLYKGLSGLVSSAEVTLVEGEGRLESRPGHTPVVVVGDQRLEGRSVVLATGSYAKTLPGLEIGGPVMTSTEVLALDHVPQRVVVLGGGVIGVELASVLASFGSTVTVIEALPRLVAAEDEAASAALSRAFRKRGITVRADTRFDSVQRTDDGVTVTLEGGDSIEADVLVVAVGRGPVSDGMGYAEAGVELDRGFVVTDERLRTSLPDVYAVGDLVAGPQLAHRGFAHGLFVADEIAGKDPAPVQDVLIPKVTYSSPEIASVGLTEAAAREQHGDAVRTYQYDLGGNGKSQILGTQGFVKVVRLEDGPIVGVHMVGERMGEQVGEAMLLVGWEATPADVTPLIHAHPTQNEAVGEAIMALAGTPLHAHG
ncbi:MAG: dihydrolipoyl dehydrogenase [Actinomycetales bacterium]|nr:dihydrolipoyl dehydrogenase [Tetrasphaera sp.]NLX00266.1 dihydrolipoyl dehydrogenase [Actinomycetales bacterium]